MTQTLQMRVDPRTAYECQILAAEVAKQLKISANRLKQVDIVKRSIDARQRRVMINLTVVAHIDAVDNTVAQPNVIDYKPLPADAKQAIVVGAGPAGLFAALRLIELGIKPIVLERGKDVDSRKKIWLSSAVKTLLILSQTIVLVRVAQALILMENSTPAAKNVALLTKY